MSKCACYPYKKYEKYDLAILDECGYKSLDKVATA